MSHGRMCNVTLGIFGKCNCGWSSDAATPIAGVEVGPSRGLRPLAPEGIDAMRAERDAVLLPPMRGVGDDEGHRRHEFLWRWLLHKLGMDPACREFGGIVGHLDNALADAKAWRDAQSRGAAAPSLPEGQDAIDWGQFAYDVLITDSTSDVPIARFEYGSMAVDWARQHYPNRHTLRAVHAHPASVSGGQPSAAGASSAPEGIEKRLSDAHRAGVLLERNWLAALKDRDRLLAVLTTIAALEGGSESKRGKSYLAAKHAATAALASVEAGPSHDAVASLAPEEQPTVLLIKPQQAAAARKLAGWPDAAHAPEEYGTPPPGPFLSMTIPRESVGEVAAILGIPDPTADVVEIHAETLIAVAAWCASEGSDDVAAAAAEIRSFVAKANA